LHSETKVFTVAETHGRVLRPNNRLIAQSEDVGWRSLYAAIFEEGPFRERECASPHPSLIYHLCRPTAVARKIDGGQSTKAVIGPRYICLTPADTTTQWEHCGNPEILQVYLRQSVYARAVNEIYGCDASAAKIIPCFAILDPLLEQLAIAIAAALRTGRERDGLYIETLAQMMAVHLARQHSSRSRLFRPPTTQVISSWKIRRVIEFIEENLGGDLTLEAMAREIEISPLYLSRAFKGAVGQPPHQYVLGRRIESAKELLRNTDMPIVDVALSAGLSSQSHLSNLFLRYVGVSPAAYRRQGHR
jgi:AraC family transcriptional regulator